MGAQVTDELDPLSQFLSEDPVDPPVAARANRWPDTPADRTGAAELRTVVREGQIIVERTGERVRDRHETGPRVQPDGAPPSQRPVAPGADARAVESLAHEMKLLADTLDRQRQAIGYGVVGASRMTELLTTLEGRIDGFASIAQTVVGLEQRAVDASTDLDQRLGEFESQRHRVDEALSEAARLIEALTRLEGQLSHLSERRILEPVEASSTRRQGPPAVRRVMGIVLGAATVFVVVALGAWLHVSKSADRAAQQADHSIASTSSAPLPAGDSVSASKGESSLEQAWGSPVAADAIAEPDRLRSPRARKPGARREPSRERDVEQADAPPRPFTGDLTIESEPLHATVFVDQRRVGETPVHLKAFRAGSHAIRIDREGYERWTAGVQVPAEQQTRVSAKLERNR